MAMSCDDSNVFIHAPLTYGGLTAGGAGGGGRTGRGGGRGHGIMICCVIVLYTWWILFSLFPLIIGLDLFHEVNPSNHENSIAVN